MSDAPSPVNGNAPSPVNGDAPSPASASPADAGRPAPARGLGRYLEAYLEHVRPALIAPELRERMLSATARLPDGLGDSLAGFECALDGSAATADLFVSVPQGTRSSRILAGTDPGECLPEPLLSHEVWGRVAALAAEWTSLSSHLFRHVREIVLQLEGSPADRGLHLRGLAVGPSDPRDPALASRCFALPAGEASGLVRGIAERLQGAPLRAAVTVRLAAALEELTANGHLVRAGFLPTRQSGAIRLWASGMPVGELPDLAARLGWPGEVAEAREALARHARWFDRISMCLDIGEDVGARLGLECSFYGKRQPLEEPRWHALIDAMVRDGLCHPRKADALQRYPGGGPLLGMSPPPGAGPARCIQLRGLDHLKLVLEPGRPVTARAYLFGGTFWRPSAGTEPRPTDPLTRAVMLARHDKLALEKRSTPYMDLPELVQIETFAACNAKCPFCPHGKMPRQGVRMPDALIEKILADLTAIPADHAFRLSPYKLSEPLLDPRLLGLLRKVTATLPGAQIMIKTNGTLLTEELLDSLGEVRLRVFSVSVNEFCESSYERVMGLPFALLLKKLDMLHERLRHDRFPVPVQMTRVRDWSADDDRFSTWALERYPLFEPHLLDVCNWLGHVETKRDPSMPEVCGTCHSISIAATGVVALCVADGMAEYPIGNAAEQHLLEIYNSERLRNIRANLTRLQETEPCKRCNIL
jgi:radical SAM protein with 4Fe4S-binding SPASM domain